MRTDAATASNRNTAASDQASRFSVFICDRCLVRRDDRAIVPRGHLIAYPSRWSDILPRNPSRHGPMIPISFEFYPPKTDEQRAQLARTAARLKALSPEYVSCTLGAGGSTLDSTPETVERLHATHALAAAPPVSCGGGCRRERGWDGHRLETQS